MTKTRTSPITTTTANLAILRDSKQALSPHATVGIHANVSGHIITADLDDTTTATTVPDPSSTSPQILSLPTARYPVHIPPLCVDARTWTSEKADDAQVKAALSVLSSSAAGGLVFIDTRPGSSEEAVGRLISRDTRGEYVLQARFDPAGSEDAPDPVRSLRESLGRMGDGVEHVDVFLLELPDDGKGRAPPEAVVRGMAECVEQGLARVVGIAGGQSLSGEAVREWGDELAKYNIPLAVCLVEERDGGGEKRLIADGELMGACREAGAVLEVALRADGAGDGDAARQQFEKGAKAQGKSVLAARLNYIMCKGAVPVVDVIVVDETAAKDVVSALGWRLDEQQIEAIDMVYGDAVEGAKG